MRPLLALSFRGGGSNPSGIARVSHELVSVEIRPFANLAAVTRQKGSDGNGLFPCRFRSHSIPASKIAPQIRSVPPALRWERLRAKQQHMILAIAPGQQPSGRSPVYGMPHDRINAFVDDSLVPLFLKPNDWHGKRVDFHRKSHDPPAHDVKRKPEK